MSADQDAPHQEDLYNNPGGAEDGRDVFKASFKFYKKRKPPPDLSNVINFSKPDYDKVTRVKLAREASTTCKIEYLLPVDRWRIWELKEHPGFMVIENPFKPQYQQYWVKRCLEDFTCKPNITNLDAHEDIDPSMNIWKQSIKGDKDKLLQKLRWVTLGYHHNWNTKVYCEEHQSPFPGDLKCLCKYVAEVLGFNSFKAEAAIINFYHLDSTLSGHTDHSELDHDAPLLSFSFGQRAIFLLGGKTKEEKPNAMLLSSGDIAVMAGVSRLAYHAVPKILPPTGREEDECFSLSESQEKGCTQSPALVCTNALEMCSEVCRDSQDNTAECSCSVCNHGKEALRTIQETEWEPFSKYLTKSRININVRQVLPKRDKFL